MRRLNLEQPGPNELAHKFRLTRAERHVAGTWQAGNRAACFTLKATVIRLCLALVSTVTMAALAIGRRDLNEINKKGRHARSGTGAKALRPE